MADESKSVEEKNIYAIATDPVYIGTGGYTIGRVDNTIVRDPSTRIPKIPGSSIAGTWRYYMTLKMLDEAKDKKWLGFDAGGINCAGQDKDPNGDMGSSSGHCGKCLVCKSFGYSKGNKDSSQGLLYFSDMNVLFFPVYTRLGVRWITSPEILKMAGLGVKDNKTMLDDLDRDKILTHNRKEDTLNLGWLNLEVNKKGFDNTFDKIIKNIGNNFEEEYFPLKKLVIVPDELISRIINSNLEVRTSVSIDPVTGASKEGALFTSEAIPRGTVFFSNVRVFDRTRLGTGAPEPNIILKALEDSKIFYETLGIGGMTTRGFGRIKILTKLSTK